MDSWCYLTPEEHISQGDFIQSTLETHSRQQLHLETEFLDHLAEIIMLRYEGKQISDFVFPPKRATASPHRTKHFYRRFFNEDNTVTQDFITWASETIALWIESTIGEALFAEGGTPHAADPAFDVLSITLDSQGTPHLRVVQVKATPHNLQEKANEAVSKFSRLENGEYDAELSARLELIERRNDAPPGINVADLIFDPDRRYRVTVVHSGDRGGFRILTTYRDKIPGDLSRRSVQLIRAQWPEFWAELGRRILEQLA